VVSTRGGEAGSTFDTVFCDLLPRLYRRAALLCGIHQAEDTVHEVYLKLVTHPQRFLSHPEPYAYAFAAMVSTMRDRHRRERRQIAVPEVEVGESGAVGSWEWDGGLGRRASELEVIDMLGRLTARQASVVILVDLDGYTIDRAAEILRLHRGTVARSRARALDKLRRIVKSQQNQQNQQSPVPER
jgi:RNA polymerase sigma-70 factor (ECF subfamily)